MKGARAAAAGAAALAGCTMPDQPELQGWAVMNPSCLIWCEAVQELVRDGAAGAIAQGEGPRP